MAKEKDSAYKVVAENRKARFEYEVIETYEAGIELFGTEVKSLRAARATISECYAGPMDNQFYLFNADIPEYKFANQFNHERKRPRRLLLARKQIGRLNGGVQREGLTVIALKLYFNERGRAKLQIALAKGKKLHDKRETEKQRDWSREKSRILKDNNR